MKDLIIGIDAGGSKTVARAYDAAGAVVAEAQAAGIDLPVIGEAEARGRLDEVRGKLEARLPPGARVLHSVVGAPGFGELGRWTDAWRRVVAKVLDGWSPSVHNDVRLAFYAAFPAGEGILVLAGTGSMAWGGFAGREARCGGWGPWFGDEGSAFHIGKQALGAAAAAADGRGPATSLVEDLPRAADASDLWELLDHLLSSGTDKRAHIARLAKEVDAAAGLGDAVASQLLADASRALVAHAVTLTKRLGGSETPVARAGGVFASETLSRAFKIELARAGLRLTERATTSPVAGALAIAHRELAEPARRSYADG